MPAITLTTRDGQTVSFDCQEDETLLDAAARQELIFPAQCKQGGCGACHAHCSSGDYELLPYSPSALSDADREQGGILLCRTQPRSDLSLTASLDRAAILTNAPARRIGVIRQLTKLNAATLRLVVQLEADEDGSVSAQFEAGQYMELETLDGTIRRAYSLSNIANWTGELEFLIRLHPTGAFSGFLQRAEVGDCLAVIGPQGGFTLQENGLRPRWFVAGGTGLAPVLSMIRRMADWQDSQPLRLYFGVTSESELFYLDEIKSLQAALPTMTFIPCVWKPQGDWTGFAGTPAQAVEQDLQALKKKPDIYICGPAPLVESCEQAAAAYGLPSGQVMSERFSV